MRSLVFAIALAACTHGGPSRTERPSDTPKDTVSAARATLEQWRQAYEVKSMDALARLYAHDGDVAVVLEGVPLVGWRSVEAMLQDRLARAELVHVRLKDVQVAQIAPDVASVLATMTREVQTGATTVTENGTITLVLRRDGDAWVIAAEHYSYKH